MNIKYKYDDEYLKLFFRHSRNFLNFYLNGNNSQQDEENRDGHGLNEENLSEKNIDNNYTVSIDSYEKEEYMEK